MSPLNVAIYGAGWIHNMGNSFIQLGSKAAVERAAPGTVAQATDGNSLDPPTPLSARLLSKLGNLLHARALDGPQRRRIERALRSQVKLPSLARLDAVVASGVWLSTKYLQEHKPDFLALKARGIPLIINGGGGTFYDEKEVKEVTLLLEEIQPFALLSRDRQSYENYRNVVKRSFPGIDAGFFIDDAFPHPLPLEKKTIYCFDRGPLPRSLPLGEHVLLTHHARNGMRHNPFTHPTFYSELVTDYLSLYANSATTVSDRVHACVATLAFGNPAQLMDKTPRARLFDMLEIGEVRETAVTLPRDVLERKKQEHLEALRAVFHDLENRRG